MSDDGMISRTTGNKAKRKRYGDEFERRIAALQKIHSKEFDAMLIRFSTEHVRRPYDDPPTSTSVHNTVLAILDTEQVSRIDEQGARIEIKTSRVQECRRVSMVQDRKD